ncbi:hypothetical protein ACT3RT_17475 [Ewingella sp. AOP9-I1-14]
MKKILLVIAVSFLAGCVSNPNPVEVSNADYGVKPSKELYELKIKSYQEERLKDPDSAKYHFGEPHKGWCKFNGMVNYGWIIDYSLNAKNSYGGYVGAKPQFAFIKNETAYHMEYFLRGNCSK